MRTVKETMKNFFTAIMCFLMNLIPAKKFWVMMNARTNDEMKMRNKNRQKSDKNTNVYVINGIESIGQAMLGKMDTNNAYRKKYIAYLYEYVDNLLLNKNVIKKRNNKVSFIEYMDTG